MSRTFHHKKEGPYILDRIDTRRMDKFARQRERIWKQGYHYRESFSRKSWIKYQELIEKILWSINWADSQLSSYKEYEQWILNLKYNWINIEFISEEDEWHPIFDSKWLELVKRLTSYNPALTQFYIQEWWLWVDDNPPQTPLLPYTPSAPFKLDTQRLQIEQNRSAALAVSLMPPKEYIKYIVLTQQLLKEIFNQS